METTSNGFERNASGCPLNPQGHYFQSISTELVSKIVSFDRIKISIIPSLR